MGHLCRDARETGCEDTFFQECEICVVGTQKLQNEMLSRILSHKFGVSCCSETTPDRCALIEDGRQVVLLDGYGYDSISEAITDVKRYLVHPDSRRIFAIYNARQDVAIEKPIPLRGVRGIFFDCEPFDLFLKGVFTLLKGGYWFPRRLLNQWVREKRAAPRLNTPNISPLTQREKEILSNLAAGGSNQEIALRMCISYHTVKTHLQRIYKKIGVHNRWQASLWAEKNAIMM
mgnify:CR=1 FL=1